MIEGSICRSGPKSEFDRARWAGDTEGAAGNPADQVVIAEHDRF